MAGYRMTIQYHAPAEEAALRPLRFAMEVEAAGEPEAKKQALGVCRDLAMAAGFRFSEQIAERDVAALPVKPPADTRLEISLLETAPEIFCGRLVGPLDGVSALRLDRESQFLKNDGVRLLCLDLGRAHPVGSAGLGVLLNINDRVEIRLVHVPPGVRKMFGVLGLDGALPYYDGFPEALAQPPRPRA